MAFDKDVWRSNSLSGMLEKIKSCSVAGKANENIVKPELCAVAIGGAYSKRNPRPKSGTPE